MPREVPQTVPVCSGFRTYKLDMSFCAADGQVPASERMNASVANAAWVQCQTTACQVTFTENGHRHCCTACRDSAGTYHTTRCRRRADQALRSRISVCVTPQCTRTSNLGHTTCCSRCLASGGQLHTRRCGSRHCATGGNTTVVQTTMVTVTHAIANVASSDSAERSQQSCSSTGRVHLDEMD